MVVQQYCCYCPSGAPAACGVPRRTNMTQRHVVHACRVMKRAVFVALLLFARDGIQRVIAPPAPVGRPAGKKSRAGAGKPGPPSQADKRRKIVETKRHDSRWKRWSGVGGGIEQGGSAGGNSAGQGSSSAGGGGGGSSSGGGGDSSSNSHSHSNSGGGGSGSGSGSSAASSPPPASSSSSSIGGQLSPSPVRKLDGLLCHCVVLRTTYWWHCHCDMYR